MFVERRVLNEIQMEEGIGIDSEIGAMVPSFSAPVFVHRYDSWISSTCM